jgi:hypothetical protein
MQSFRLVNLASIEKESPIEFPLNEISSSDVKSYIILTCFNNYNFSFEFIFQFSFGVIPNVRAKGKASVRIADILNRMQAEEPVNSSDMAVPEINTLILLDREVDMITPLCSQLTYEGLLDEFLHINNGSVEVDASILGTPQDGKKTKVPLNSSDKLFKEIRDLNFEVVGQYCRFCVKKQHPCSKTTQI